MIFLQYILPSIIAVGGVVISSLISYKQFKTKMEKEIENIEKEHDLENKDHAKRMHYETTFQIYKDISNILFNMSIDVLLLFYVGLDSSLPRDEKEKYKTLYKRYNTAHNSFLQFTKTLYANAPFIEKEVFEKLLKFREKCSKQILWYPDLILNPDSELAKENAEEKQKCYDRSNEIYKELYECIDFLRSEIKKNEA